MEALPPQSFNEKALEPQGPRATVSKAKHTLMTRLGPVSCKKEEQVRQR
jgi:hypothetical protein